MHHALPFSLVLALAPIHPSIFQEQWNVTLFHYRSHGADKGKVLVGFDIPEDAAMKADDFLDSLNYPYVNETHNPVYKNFLA